MRELPFLKQNVGGKHRATPVPLLFCPLLPRAPPRCRGGGRGGRARELPVVEREQRLVAQVQGRGTAPEGEPEPGLGDSGHVPTRRGGDLCERLPTYLPDLFSIKSSFLQGSSTFLKLLWSFGASSTLTSGSYMGFPAFPAKLRDNFGEKKGFY